MCILQQKFLVFVSLVLLTLVAVLGFTFSFKGSFFDGRPFWGLDMSERSNNENNNVDSSQPPNLPDFVKPNRKCKVPFGSDRAHLPPCTHSLLRSYYSKMASYPECGAWVETAGYGYSQRYILDFCEFKPYNLPECSLRNGLHHILFAGDSVGWRTYLSMVNTSIWAGSNCHLVKSEGTKSRTPSTEYFSVGHRSLNNSFVVVDRSCLWCRANVYDCEMRTESGYHTVRLEFAPAYKFRDPSLTISPGNPKWSSAETFQEFLFSTYLPMVGMPDAIVLPFPLNHEEAMHRTTQIHWLPTASKFPSKLLPKDRVHLNDGDHSKVYRIASQLTKVLEPYLQNSSYNMYGFVSLFNMSATKEDWNEDSIHFNYLWYAHVIRTLLSILCAG
ncbi:hypothetical protein CAPTEDRAFT_218708 [Capitella teleta]|uniref:Uncharacterized protein n=1 Tax=Capitella teleta TaxID=283909 RepID=R7UTQ3_CAPTE|nr:hypothetical protein CAPTEDRAFT_218708 [Capitella teleta]|eukprot:ELU09904.1 hypothetical protein CAPTEDRAFT_218708 [Capitella teleta]